jgi:hypothetical protein
MRKSCRLQQFADLQIGLRPVHGVASTGRKQASRRETFRARSVTPAAWRSRVFLSSSVDVERCSLPGATMHDALQLFWVRCEAPLRSHDAVGPSSIEPCAGPDRSLDLVALDDAFSKTQHPSSELARARQPVAPWKGRSQSPAW